MGTIKCPICKESYDKKELMTVCPVCGKEINKSQVKKVITDILNLFQAGDWHDCEITDTIEIYAKSIGIEI